MATLMIRLRWVSLEMQPLSREQTFTTINSKKISVDLKPYIVLSSVLFHHVCELGKYIKLCFVRIPLTWKYPSRSIKNVFTTLNKRKIKCQKQNPFVVWESGKIFSKMNLILVSFARCSRSQMFHQKKKQFSTNLVDILQKSLNNWKPNVLGKRSEYDISHDHNVPAVKCKTRLKTHSYKLRTVFKTTR